MAARSLGPLAAAPFFFEDGFAGFEGTGKFVIEAAASVAVAMNSFQAAAVALGTVYVPAVVAEP